MCRASTVDNRDSKLDPPEKVLSVNRNKLHIEPFPVRTPLGRRNRAHCGFVCIVPNRVAITQFIFMKHSLFGLTCPLVTVEL